MQLVEDFRRRRWLTVRRTYHVAGADAADVGDLACGFPAGHCEGYARSDIAIQDSMTMNTAARKEIEGPVSHKTYVASLALVGCGEDR